MDWLRRKFDTQTRDTTKLLMFAVDPNTSLWRFNGFSTDLITWFANADGEIVLKSEDSILISLHDGVICVERVNKV